MVDNDSDLLRSLKSDDEIAFKVIFNKYYSRLYYFILEFIPVADLAENIVQDTFVTLWTKRKELTDTTNFGAYLYTVAKNNCIYRLRDQKYRKKLFSEHFPDAAELETNLEVLSAVNTSVFTFEEIERIVQETLAGLPPQCKRVFLLRFEEKKNREIAEELNISVKVVEKHISKGLKIFKIALKDYLPFVNYLFVP